MTNNKYIWNKIAQDKPFTYSMLKRFNIKSIAFDVSDSTKKYPDIWVEMNKVPVITVTREWARQNTNERRKRILHELLHVYGLEHDAGIGYNSIPSKDTYSKDLYKYFTGKNPVLDFPKGMKISDSVAYPWRIEIGTKPDTYRGKKYTKEDIPGAIGHEVGHVKLWDDVIRAKHASEEMNTFLDEVQAWGWILKKSNGRAVFTDKIYYNLNHYMQYIRDDVEKKKAKKLLNWLVKEYGLAKGNPTSVASIEEYRESFITPFNRTVHEFQKLFPGGVQARIKTVDSIREKVERRKKKVEELTDIAGIRVVFLTLDTLYDGLEKIRKNFKVVEEEDYISQPKEGYRSYHLLIVVSGKIIEVQLKTLRMFDWSEPAHETIYKPKSSEVVERMPEISKYRSEISDYYLSQDMGLSKPKPQAPSFWSRLGLPMYLLNPFSKVRKNMVVYECPRCGDKVVYDNTYRCWKCSKCGWHVMYMEPTYLDCKGERNVYNKHKKS